MRLSAVAMGKQFTVNGNLYAHDLNGYNSGGKIAVKNLDTTKSERMVATTEVELVEDMVDPPKVEETESQFDLYIPEPEELVDFDDMVDSNEEEVEDNVSG